MYCRRLLNVQQPVLHKVNSFIYNYQNEHSHNIPDVVRGHPTFP